MIDTDKYEGHIENIGRWQMFANALPRWAEDADRKLVQDAPLLLAEVKRLQERLDWILGDEELADYVWEKEVAYMEWEGVRLPWISADEWGEEE